MIKSVQIVRCANWSMIQCRGYHCTRNNAACRALRRFAYHAKADRPLIRSSLWMSKVCPQLPHHHLSVAECADLSSQKYTLIYALPTITMLRTLSRLKLIQTGITAVILPPVYYFYIQGDVTASLVYSSTGIAVFAAVMLYTISYFARRVVGRMYLDSTGSTLKVSHLTFWGNRKDLYMPVNDVMTIADVGDTSKETILLLKRFSTSDTMYYSTRLGRVVDRTGFQKVFGSLS